MGMKEPQRGILGETKPPQGKDSPGPLTGKRRRPPETEKEAPSLFLVQTLIFQASYWLQRYWEE